MMREPYSSASVSVERMFEVLQEALNAAVETHGDKAKAFAWDVKGHFLTEFGPRAGRAAKP